MNFISKILITFLLTVSVISIPVHSHAEETDSDTNIKNVAELQEMLDFIGDTKKISVEVKSNYDAVQQNGQLIEFGAVSSWYLKRPDKVRVEIKYRDGNERNFYFDGSTITLYDRDQNVYAEVKKNGNIDQAFDYYMDKLDMPLPLAELFSKDHPFDLKKDIESSTNIGNSVVNGVQCNDLAYRTKDIDLQIWINEKGEPLPQRFVITYNAYPGKPQYRADFKDWDLSPKLSDSLFKFTPPEKAEKIEFIPLKKNTGQ